MRLGGPLFADCSTPEAWVAAAREAGYRAVYCPVGPQADAATVAAYRHAAAEADLVIAEVGAWSNPLSRDAATRSAALETCRAALDLAERIGARCAVNITGSRGDKWDGPYSEDLTSETFDAIVETVRTIVDAVQPTRAAYTLETMPWMYPDSVDSYEALLRAIDRPAVAVHFDPVNLVNCPARYFDTAGLVREFVARLGPRIRSCHLKDITMSQAFMVHLDECRPGAGSFDYRTLLRELDRLDADLPVMLEHLPDAEQYRLAGDYVRGVAAELGVTL